MKDEAPNLLPPESFARVVRDSPLVAFDLIVRPPDGSVLVGFRKNEPARHFWFVPGGRILKGERLAAAFERITREELGRAFPIGRSRLLGAYEHFYDTNFASEPGFGTHYIVLGHELRPEARIEELPRGQHTRYRWLGVEELLADPEVHPHTKAYFREG